MFFPAADTTRAFAIAAFKDHRAVVDAIWGSNQFEVTDDTKRILTLITRTSPHEPIRMLFGPSPDLLKCKDACPLCLGSQGTDKGRSFVRLVWMI